MIGKYTIQRRKNYNEEYDPNTFYEKIVSMYIPMIYVSHQNTDIEYPFEVLDVYILVRNIEMKYEVGFKN